MGIADSHKAVIVTAPSGSGKTTIVNHLVNQFPELVFSVSACTRPKRTDESHGKDYYFMSVSEFLAKVDEDAFVEWEEVYPGSYYGTLKEEVNKIWQSGKVVIFDVDVKGALNLKSYFGNQGFALFIRLPSIEELKNRLSERNSEDQDSMEERIKKSVEELQYEGRFEYSLLNDELDSAKTMAAKVIASFLNR